MVNTIAVFAAIEQNKQMEIGRLAMKEAPLPGEDYWRMTDTGGWLYCWTGCDEDLEYLRKNRAFATREAVGKALDLR